MYIERNSGRAANNLVESRSHQEKNNKWDHNYLDAGLATIACIDQGDRMSL
jgi:hypothetical protein